MKSAILLATLIFGVTAVGAPLEIGQAAPELTITKWIKNGPVSLKDGKGKNIYVVEFWATWCPPCRKSIPHLSKLQKEYKDKGLVVVGITNEDPAVVEPFVKEQADMNYNVGVDTAGNTYNAYMEGRSAIPQAFIIDKNGVVVWNGHPMEMDSVLKKVIEGTFDMEKGEKVSDLQAKMMDALKVRDMESGLTYAKDILQLSPDDEQAMQVVLYIYTESKKWQEALDFLNKLIAMHPKESMPYMVAFQILNELDDHDNIKKLAGSYIKQFWDDAPALNALAMFLLDQLNFGTEPLKEALDAAERAVEITKASDKMALADYTDTLARCYYAVGRIDKAVEAEKKAVELLKGSEGEQYLIDKLKFYNDALKIGSEIK